MDPSHNVMLFVMWILIPGEIFGIFILVKYGIMFFFKYIFIKIYFGIAALYFTFQVFVFMDVSLTGIYYF